MAHIPEITEKIPMMFRAQINGRCQLQRIVKGQESDAELWIDEWVDKAYPDLPQFGEGVQTNTYTLTWRFVTNGGQDDGIIRPVIGTKGIPFYPGSSMKGVFRQACTAAQADLYCGQDLGRDGHKPGILRFHGGYPANTSWTEHLLDIVHPQQNWQVKEDVRTSGAFVQISLYKPTLKFGISSTTPDVDWDEVWQIWEKALATGLGCRVSAGYGQPEQQTGEILYKTRLKGQGQAAKLLDGTGEFRPNIFRAAIRGHALRIFGGLTDANTADRLVEQLFGGVQGQGTVGLLSMSFQESHLEMDTFGQGAYEQPTYTVEGDLIWKLTRSLPSDQQEVLTKLIAAVTRFAMVLGGFGKSWRRADHRLFYEEYYDRGYNPLIGCHWTWTGERSLIRDVQVRKLEKFGDFIDSVCQAAQDWMQLQGEQSHSQNWAKSWREAWHPDKVQVWGRLAESVDDCEAIRWLHGPYRQAIPRVGLPEGSIYQTSVTGKVNQIGQVWHRMYPAVRLVKDPANPAKPKPLLTQQFFELLTFFPDNSPDSQAFAKFLLEEQKLFEKLWKQ